MKTINRNHGMNNVLRDYGEINNKSNTEVYLQPICVVQHMYMYKDPAFFLSTSARICVKEKQVDLVVIMKRKRNEMLSGRDKDIITSNLSSLNAHLIFPVQDT